MDNVRVRSAVLHATAYALCFSGAAAGASLLISYLPSGRPLQNYFGGGLIGAALGLGATMVPVTCIMRYLEIKGFLERRPDETRSSSSSGSQELSDKVKD